MKEPGLHMVEFEQVHKATHQMRLEEGDGIGQDHVLLSSPGMQEMGEVKVT